MLHVEALKCPACASDVKMSFVVADEDKTSWAFCMCGSSFHQKKLDPAFFNRDYVAKFAEYKGTPERFAYLERVYLPLVQELTYGRSFLDVGFTLDHHIKNLEAQGWLTEGIDIAPNDYIEDDFLTHPFSEQYEIEGKKEKIDHKYDFIKMGHVLGCMSDPIGALFKAHQLLNDNGVLLITDPDGELLYKTGVFNYGHLKWKERWAIFSERQMKKILESLGFRIILSRKNEQERFMRLNDYHIIAQKARGK